MDDIARRAGVTKPVLYQHFGSKLELYLAVFDASVEDVVAAVGKGLQSTPDNRSRVTATMDVYLGFMVTEDAVYRLVFESDLVNLPAVRERVEQVNARCAEMVAAVIAEDTGLSHDQAMLLASGMHGLVQVSARNWMRSGEDRPPREQAAELVASLAWRGISSFPLSHPPQAE